MTKEEYIEKFIELDNELENAFDDYNEGTINDIRSRIVNLHKQMAMELSPEDMLFVCNILEFTKS